MARAQTLPGTPEREDANRRNREASQRYRDKYPERARARVRLWKTEGNPAQALLTRAGQGAKARGLQHSVSVEEVQRCLEPMVCNVTGLRLYWDYVGPGRNPRAPSLDRIDSSRGYVSGNVQIVCWAYNRFKEKLSDETAVKLLKEMAQCVV